MPPTSSPSLFDLPEPEPEKPAVEPVRPVAAPVASPVAAIKASEPVAAPAGTTGYSASSIEVLEGLERMMDYGLSSRPLPGAEGLIVSVAGSRGNGVVLALGDRRYRMALEEGEVALHDDLGQVVHLTREGIRIASSLRVEIEAPEISLSAGTEMTLASPKIVLASEDLRLGGEGATVAVARHDDAVVAGKVVATSTTVKST